ncbi:alpha/beta fold hydrolase [Zunongwangia sp. SCSIO 43204]|uniref:alpha/beta hydrolase n=1 Tax=Zunongwangia sp. SCSIO 43204 TaxID=2779359 RepID=UPI001CA7BE48|nr:alpha/beta fold hydrolase [Zunongwangia sp. SCSIO 43204]UAB83196.1 alpha/beta fold hydrolase [Zunongwangia sp. SCSIO 43204]
MQTANLSLEHLIKQPKGQTEKAPVVFMFHGYGSNEQDLFSFAGELPEDFFVISVKAPYPMQPSGNAWYAIYFDDVNGKFSDDDQAIESRDLIAKFIDEAIEAYPINKNKVTLLGFSQGSILSYAVALSYPEKVKNVIALSGYVNKAIIKNSFENNDFEHLNFYCSHGTVDQVIPIDSARKTKPFLDQLTIKNTYSEFPVGHGVAPQNFFELKEWLEKNG